MRNLNTNEINAVSGGDLASTARKFFRAVSNLLPKKKKNYKVQSTCTCGGIRG